jgi:hypothetical protein
MTERTNPNNKQISDTSPKDLKQLEILKPRSMPSMGQRHRLSLEKEKRLEVASRPIQKKSSEPMKDRETVESNGPEQSMQKGKRKKHKKKSKNESIGHESTANETSKNGLDQEDMVEDLNWSDDE